MENIWFYSMSVELPVIAVLLAKHLFLVLFVALAVIWKQPLEVPLVLRQQAARFPVLSASGPAPHTVPADGCSRDSGEFGSGVVPSFPCRMGLDSRCCVPTVAMWYLTKKGIRVACNWFIWELQGFSQWAATGGDKPTWRRLVFRSSSPGKSGVWILSCFYSLSRGFGLYSWSCWTVTGRNPVPKHLLQLLLQTSCREQSLLTDFKIICAD